MPNDGRLHLWIFKISFGHFADEKQAIAHFENFHKLEVGISLHDFTAEETANYTTYGGKLAIVPRYFVCQLSRGDSGRLLLIARMGDSGAGLCTSLCVVCCTHELKQVRSILQPLANVEVAVSLKVPWTDSNPAIICRG